ncbi:MAG: response regulator [Verrucomicrobiales bacterium]|nr:response regulator [Verrucomicrobiales bacterium]
MSGPTESRRESDPSVAGIQSVVSWLQAIAPYGILTTDRSLRIQTWNQWLVFHSGLSASEAIGRSLVELFPDLQQRRLLSRFESALAGEISVLSTALHKYLLPFPVTIEGCRSQWMLQTARIAPLPDEDRIVGTITIIEDVTQREFHAYTLRRQQELDRLLSESLGAMMESTHVVQDLGAILTPMLPYLGFDAHFCYVWHPGINLFQLRSCSGVPTAQREVMRAKRLANEDRLNSSGGPANILKTMAKHAKVLTALGMSGVSCWPLSIADEVLGFISFGSYPPSVLEREEYQLLSRLVHFLALALDRASKSQRVLAASRAKDDFLAALSHELRTPLNPVLMLASDGAQNPELAASVRESFRLIEKNALLEARLIDDLLDLTRIENGKVSLDLLTIDGHTAVMDAIENVRTDAAQKNIVVVLQLQADRSYVHADPARLQQILWNVIKNGIKFTPPGGRLWISSSVEGESKYWKLEVKDTGIGMEPAELARIFDAFSQGEHASEGGRHRFGGLGLGLAITKKLVELFEGTIEASSPGRGRGSTFLVRLPLSTAPPSSEAPARPLRSPPAAPSTSFQSDAPAFRILLVEDHEPTRSPFASLLGRRGYEVVAVGSGVEALEAAARSGFDVVLADIDLPDIDGHSLMGFLNKRYGLKGLALTGHGTETDVAKSLESGFVAHFTKPINLSALEEVLRELLASRRDS